MGFAQQDLRIQLPNAGKGGIRQFQAPVTAENRDPLIEIIQGFLLHRDQGVVGTFQHQAVGDVFLQKEQAAKRVRRDHLA